MIEEKYIKEIYQYIKSSYERNNIQGFQPMNDWEEVSEEAKERIRRDIKITLVKVGMEDNPKKFIQSMYETEENIINRIKQDYNQ